MVVAEQLVAHLQHWDGGGGEGGVRAAVRSWVLVHFAAACLKGSHGCEARGERGWVVRLTGEVCGGVGVCPTSKRFSRVGMSTAVMSTSCLQRVPVWSLRKRSMMGTSLGSTYTIGSPCVTTPVVMTLGSIDLMLCRICCAGVKAGGFAAGGGAVVQRARRTTGIERMTPVLPKRLPQGGHGVVLEL